MDFVSSRTPAAYWSGLEVAANIVIGMNLIGALLLGLLVGYERSFHGRAAGMRTYGLVCIAFAALTVITGYAGLRYGGQGTDAMSVDPTRVMQGIVIGIGFPGAGVIMKEGFSINGLNAASSIWASLRSASWSGSASTPPRFCLPCSAP